MAGNMHIWILISMHSHFQFNQQTPRTGSSGNMYPPGHYNHPYNSSSSFNGFQGNSSHWQFNPGFQDPGSYNGYNNFNASQQQWQQPQHWNNGSWNYYNNQPANPATAAATATGESSSSSYQRTLEYVQQCQQQQSWSANTNPSSQ
jgi:hypothetical protein